MGRLVRRCFALPLLYAKRARHWPGGMMGGPVPRAAVRASRQRDARGSGAVKRGRSLARRDACTAGGLANGEAAGRIPR